MSLFVDDREINMEDGAENNLERELPPGENKKNRTGRRAVCGGGGENSVPSDRNRSPRRGGRGADILAGAAREKPGRSDMIHQGTRDRSERSTSPDPRRPRTHHLHPGVAAGAGEAVEGGAVGRHAGGFVRFWCTQSEDEIPFDVLDHRLWPPDKRAAQDFG